MNLLKNKAWRLFIAALVFGLMAGLGTIVYLKVMEKRMEEKLKPAKQDYTPVIVASRDLNIGDSVSSDTVAVRQIPSAYVAADAVTPHTFDSIAGATMIKNLAHGRMLTRELIDLNIPKDFSATVNEGHRAITISVDDLNAVAELVRPGNFVDIYTRLPAMAAQSPEGTQGQGDTIIPVLDKVLVLATGKKAARANEDEFTHYDEVKRSKTYNTITLELSPEKAALLAVAREEGELILVLRNKKDSGGTPFSTIDRSDLFANSKHMQEEALKQQSNRSLDGVHKTADGKLVTRDGIVITDPNVRMNKAGLLVTKDGVVLSGRGLSINAEGKVVDEHGAVVDTASLVAGKDGVLIDKNGNVLSSNGFETLKGGFVKDKDGNILTNDGQMLHGVSVDAHGNVITADGQILTAKNLKINKDGSVTMVSKPLLHVNKKGQIVDKNGKVIHPDQILTTDAQGRVHTKDGTLIPGVHKGADGKYYDKNGKELSQKQLVERYNKSLEKKLAGVSASPAKGFADNFTNGEPAIQNASRQVREIEFIIGGGSKGTATRFNVPVEDLTSPGLNFPQEK